MTDLRLQKYSAIYLCANASKSSITLDLKHPDAKEVIHWMVKNADIVFENFKAGTMDRMGYGWGHLTVINSKLIYCAVTGLGQTGPRSQSAAYVPTVQGLSGVMTVYGRR